MGLFKTIWVYFLYAVCYILVIVEAFFNTLFFKGKKQYKDTLNYKVLMYIERLMG